MQLLHMQQFRTAYTVCIHSLLLDQAAQLQLDLEAYTCVRLHPTCSLT